MSRVRELALVADSNAATPFYLDRPPRPSSASGQPLINERQREKVVKYINEVRAAACHTPSSSRTREIRLPRALCTPP